MVTRSISRLQQDFEGFQQLAAILLRWTGIRLPEGMQGMVLLTSRVQTLVAAKAMHSLRAYAAFLAPLKAEHPDREAFVSALSTHTTSFFRESVHFDVLQEAYRGARGTFKVWSAACSTGAEAYSMAMTLESARTSTGLDYRILATDVAEDVLLEGVRGIIADTMAQQIPQRLRERYWSRQRELENRQSWVAGQQLRKNIRWAKLNLVDRKQYPREGSFDVIFCRNVLIYFEPETTRAILEGLTSCLKPGGLLVLGHAESGAMTLRSFERLGSSVFRKSEVLRPEPSLRQNPLRELLSSAR
jgi:chemotaxis protein methyltransferase CheR